MKGTILSGSSESSSSRFKPALNQISNLTPENSKSKSNLPSLFNLNGHVIRELALHERN